MLPPHALPSVRVARYELGLNVSRVCAVSEDILTCLSVASRAQITVLFRLQETRTGTVAKWYRRKGVFERKYILESAFL
jgi:hypothetical protein